MDGRAAVIAFVVLIGAMTACDEGVTVVLTDVADIDGTEADVSIDTPDEDVAADTADVGDVETDTDSGADTVDAAADTGDIDPEEDASDADAGMDVVDAAEGDAADTGDIDAGDVDTGMPPTGPVRYPRGRLHSPTTPYVVDRLAAIRARGEGFADNVFMKVGDSITIDTNFLTCLAGDVDLSGYPELTETLEFFQAGDAAGVTPFNRDPESAVSGRTAYWAITGDPSPVDSEIAAIGPGWAVVMYGTNDMGWFGEDMGSTFRWYIDHYLTLIDGLIDRGIVPILSTIPHRDNHEFLDHWVPTVNDVVRAIAQSRQIPIVDLHLALDPLPDHGLWSDGVHPDVAPGGACDFSASGLEHGQNNRNLLTLQALDRMRRVVLAGEAAPDEGTTWEVRGEGVLDDPRIVDVLPFVDEGNTRVSSSDMLDAYGGCDARQNEAGPEIFYRLELTEATRLRALALDQGGVDIDLHLLDATASVGGCLARDDTVVQGTIGPGTYYLVADTFVGIEGDERSGEFMLVVTTCELDDTACDVRLD